MAGARGVHQPRARADLRRAARSSLRRRACSSSATCACRASRRSTTTARRCSGSRSRSTPRATATVTQEQGRLLVAIDADALDAAASRSAAAEQLLTGIRVVDPNTIQLDLGPRFSVVPLVAAGLERRRRRRHDRALSAAGVDILRLRPAHARSPVHLPHRLRSPASLPVFGGAARPTIRTIVIDPGHGGDDNGVKGAGGALEKDVALAVARRVKGAIEGRLGMRVLLTREDDNRVDADGRAAIANNNKADLFISLHANGSPRPATRGAVDLHAEPRSRRRRRAPPIAGRPRRAAGVRRRQRAKFALVEWELAQAAHLDGSNAFAGIVDQKLRATAGLPSVALQTRADAQSRRHEHAGGAHRDGLSLECRGGEAADVEPNSRTASPLALDRGDGRVPRLSRAGTAARRSAMNEEDAARDSGCTSGLPPCSWPGSSRCSCRAALAGDRARLRRNRSRRRAAEARKDPRAAFLCRRARRPACTASSRKSSSAKAQPSRPSRIVEAQIAPRPRRRRVGHTGRHQTANALFHARPAKPMSI